VLQIIRQAKAGKPTRSFIGMQVAHLGIAVFVIGVTMVGAYQEEKDVRMLAGESVSVGGYQIQLQGVSAVPGPNYKAMQGTFLLTRNGKLEATMYPEKRSYFSSTMPMTEAAIDVGLTRDIYVSLGEELEDKAWAVRVYYKPFVDWIWFGCLLMALGGVLAISDKRYRMKLRKVAT
jgi:cytochrome c-type biogenesis protein CcmF